MSEVKRFKACPFLAAFMTEGVDCVLASDYDKQAQEIERLNAELEQVKNSLSDPESVLVNIMRGYIAKPTLRSMLTLYGDIYNTEEAASARITELESELEQVKKAQGVPVATVKAVPTTDWKCLDFAPDFVLQDQKIGAVLYTAPPVTSTAPVLEWISVSERLPAETHAYGCHTDAVLCRTRSGKVIIALLARTTTGDVWYDQRAEERDVTHWMPLPAAPSPGKQQGGDV